MNAEMEMPSTMNSDLITRSLNFHGQLLQKSWEAERGEGDLQKLNVTNLDFNVYSQRQKHLSFQDRGKRLKLHQFISKRAGVLFDTSLIEKEEPKSNYLEPGHFAQLPAFESFLNLDKTSRSQHFLQCLAVGDIIICSITNKANTGLILKVLCVDGENARSVADLNLKAFCPTSNLISAVDKKNVPRSFMLNDLVACEVLEVMPDAEKIICGMKGVQATDNKGRLGLFHSDDFPEAYKLSLENKNEPYEEMLEKSLGFHNPSNIVCLSSIMGLGNNYHSNIVALKSRFPEAEYATELRNVQAAKWAFRSVSEGIEHYKAKRMTEAFQCINRALSIDPTNIEGLVARGALFANSGGFKKALDDFEIALKLDHSHKNAKKYMGETLVAHGRSYEDDGKLDEAMKCYEKCLEVVPDHEEALSSIQFIKAKMANGSMSLTDGMNVTSKAQGVKDTLKLLLGTEQHSVPPKDEATSSAKKKKKEKKPKKHKRHSSSSSSSSSSGSSSSSSSSSSSDSSSATSNDSHRKKKHKRKSEQKEKSLSPLSKRMAIMDSSAATETDGQRGSHYNPPAMPYSFSSEPSTVSAVYPPAPKSDKESEYEQRVCKFLEQTKGDSDYEEKVRKFLDETAKWKKDRKAIEEKAKKKRKKEKKARSKNKKKKREERKKKKMLKELEEKKLRDALRKQRRRSSNVEDEEEFLYGDKPDLRLSLPDLEDLQSKLSYYVKVEKGPSKKKEKSSSVEKLVAAAQAKAKASSPKVIYLHDEEKEEPRTRKLEKKKLDMFEESPPLQRPQEPKNVPLPSAPPPASAKFKMQIGSNQPRLKKRGEKGEEKDTTWDNVEEKRFIYVNEGVGVSKEPEPKKVPDKKKDIEEQMAKTPMIMDKLGGFRINPLNAEKKPSESQAPSAQKRKLRPRVSESDSSDSDVVIKKKERERAGRSPASSRSRSRSRSNKKYSSESPPPKKYSSSSSRSPSYRKERSHSKSGSYRSRSGRRYHSSESGSYRSRSYSRSRSRSRSMDYHRRSRSRSDDRHHYRKYPGRYPRNRGTYYRPRFQTGFKTRPGGFFPRGNRRGGQWRPGGRPFMPRMRGRGRPRFFHNNYKPRDDRYRRYDRDLSRSDDDDGSPMRKVDAAKERIDRMLSDDKRHSGPLSEGEERDDDYIDRKDYNRDRRGGSSSPELERSKKEGSKDRKGKPNPW